MSALPSLNPIRTYQSIQRQADRRAAAINERAAEIDADTAKVTGLFMAEADSLNREERGNGHNELIELSVHAMNAWPVMEKMIAGLPISPAEALAPPALFRALKPLLDQRAVMVRESAEEELQAEAKAAAREVYL